MKKLRLISIRCLTFSILIGCFACNNNTAVNNSIKVTKENQQPKNISSAMESYVAALETFRAGKDVSMTAKGIIEPEKLATFKGLKYFVPDSTYVFKAKFELINPEKVVFKTNDTRSPEYYKFCKFSFIAFEKPNELYGYVEDIHQPDGIFLPFKDASGNKETYGGGRYIDIHYNGEQTMMILDFNYAYNPYCHYNHNYSCPLVPAENVLSIPIFAGEKKLYD